MGLCYMYKITEEYDLAEGSTAINPVLIYRMVGVSKKEDPEAFAEQVKKFESRPLYKFKLPDDDGIPYYTSYSDDCTSERAFDPLDHYSNSDGCTEIQYLNEWSQWETL